MSRFIEVIPYTASGTQLRSILLNTDKIIHVRKEKNGNAIVALESEELFVLDYDGVAESLKENGGS